MILITGGTGYIGSHTCVELVNAGYSVVILDNLYNSSRQVLNRLHHITGQAVEFVEGDIRDRQLLTGLFRHHDFEAVMHFAGLKAVGESCEIPLVYYENNVAGTVNLCRVMAEQGLKNLVFSSSATVYGDPEKLPITEDMPLSTANPYGRSKLMIENILRDLQQADPHWNIALLRYFNPVGAHASGLIGEDPADIPNNLMPYIAQVAAGGLEWLSVFGNDYPTPDGTGVRDYIHVVDLAKGHLKAIEKLRENSGVQAWNLGVGRGYSVLEMITAFEQISGQSVPYRIAPRRTGDIAACYADPTKAERELNWRAALTLTEMITDTWRWQSGNPDGYGS